MLERLPSDQHVTFGCFRNLLVLRSHSPEAPETFTIIEANLRTVLRRHPKGAGLLLIVEHSEPPPTGYVERVQRLLDAYRSQLIATCAVLDARGFAAAVQRATATAILSVSRMRGRLTVHESLETAIPWLAERILPETDRGKLERELRSLLLSARPLSAEPPPAPRGETP